MLHSLSVGISEPTTLSAACPRRYSTSVSQFRFSRNRQVPVLTVVVKLRRQCMLIYLNTLKYHTHTEDNICIPHLEC